MTSGRWFSNKNVGDDNNIVLNETAIKEFKIPTPVIGRSFEFKGKKGQIIGVVKDFHFRSPKEKIMPLAMYRGENLLRTIFIKTSSSNFQLSIKKTEMLWRELLLGETFDYEFLNETYDKLHKNEQKQLLMFNAFTGIVLLISCFGLFGLATFAAEVRIKEIGIRKVLGSSVIGIVKLLSKDFLILVLLALVLASPIAWWVIHKWLQNFAYHIDVNWQLFVEIGVFSIIITLLTVSYQAIKAALMNPVKSLKTE